jgi:hypothetical protein
MCQKDKQNKEGKLFIYSCHAAAVSSASDFYSRNKYTERGHYKPGGYDTGAYGQQASYGPPQTGYGSGYDQPGTGYGQAAAAAYGNPTAQQQPYQLPAAAVPGQYQSAPQAVPQFTPMSRSKMQQGSGSYLAQAGGGYGPPATAVPAPSYAQAQPQVRLLVPRPWALLLSLQRICLCLRFPFFGLRKQVMVL